MKTWREVLRQAGFPEIAVVLDFETYFDKDYSLSKLSTIEYVRDPRFVCTSLAWKILDGTETRFADGGTKGYYISWYLKRLVAKYGKQLEGITVVGQRLKFDALILQEVFGITPKFTVDIIDLDKMWDARARHRLADLAERWKAPSLKGDTKQFIGKRWEDFTSGEKANARAYNINDVEIEAWLFEKLMPIVVSRPEVELPVANHTLQMYLKPAFKIDVDLGDRIVAGMKAEMQRPIDRLNALGLTISIPVKGAVNTPGTGKWAKRLEEWVLGGNAGDMPVLCEPARPIVASDISKDGHFRLLIEACGGSVPMKSGKNGDIPALAKDDEGTRELLAHSDPRVRALAEARQAVQSWPLHYAKVENILSQARMRGGLIGTPLGYHNAHTGRWGGSESINLQNLGGRGRGGKGTHKLIQQVRNMLRAPDGTILGINDYSKVEAVGLAWQAGQDDLTEAFRTGADAYSDLATELFGFPVRKPKKYDPKPVAARLEVCRGFGKDAILGCLAFGTPILTDTGFKPIENVSLSDKLWDGRKWVRHYGVIYKGGKSCVEVNGVWMTPEHEVWTPDGWTTAVELNTNSRTLEKHTAPLQLSASNAGPAAGSSPSNVVAPAVESLLRDATIWSPENLHAVLSVLKRHPGKLRAMILPSRSHIAHACLTEFVRLLAGVRPDHIFTMAKEVSECGPIGSEIESLFLNTWSRCLGGMTHNLTSTELIIIGDMNLVISDSLRGSRICETADILNSGPSHRFQARNLIVSNCGYGMGAVTFYERCYANDDLRPKFDDGTFGMAFIEKVIKTYRSKYKKIPAYWNLLEKSWRWATKYKEKVVLDRCGLEFFYEDGATFIRLPSGRLQRYPHATVGKDGRLRYHWGQLWGGTLTENVISALCRDLIAESILRLIENGFVVVLTVHDEIVCLLEEKDAESQLKEMGQIMCELPAWATGFPLSVEGCLSECYKK